MPNPVTMQFPKPKNWDEFETICWDLFRQIWKDENTTRHGRSGQRQFGVDIYGYLNNQLVGAQCKGKDEGLESELTEKELRAEIEKAKGFKPRLTNFTIVTTSPRDAKIQQIAREISEQHIKQGFFKVQVWGWEDVCERLPHYPAIIKTYWGQFYRSTADFVLNDENITEIPEESEKPIKLVHGVKASTDIQVVLAFQTLESEHHAEVDESRRLIESGQPKAALEILLGLQKRIFGQTTDSVKFRILTNIGAANLRLGNLKEASNFFLQAKQYNPQDEKALVNTATAHLLNGNLNEAEKFAKQVIEKNPANSSAWSLRVQIENGDIQGIVKEIPQSVRHSNEVAIAIAEVYLKEKNYISAQEELKVSIENDKAPKLEIKRLYADVILNRLLEDKKLVITCNPDEEQKRLAQECLKYYNEIFERLPDEEDKKRLYGLLVNRGVIHKILGDEASSTKDNEHALLLDPTDEQAKKNKVVALISSNKQQEALDFFKANPPGETDYDLRLLQVTALLNQKQVEPAQQILSVLVGDDKPERIKKDALLLEAESYCVSENFEEAERKCDFVRRHFPQDLRAMILGARIRRFSKKTVEAAALIADVYKRVEKDTSLPILVELADELYLNQKYEEAANLYDRFVEPKLNNNHSKRLIASYVRSGQVKKALDFCKKSRELGVLSQEHTETEANIYESILDYVSARKCYEEYLKIDPKNIEIQLRLALLNYKDGKKESVTSFLNAAQSSEFGTNVRLGLPFSNLLHKMGRHTEAIDLLYKIRNRNFNSPEAHLQYVGVFMSLPDSSVLKVNTSTVQTGFAFCVENGTSIEWYVVEDSKYKDLRNNILPADHQIVKAALGKKVGDEIVINGPFAPKSLGKIVELKHKYIYALHESMSKFSSLFPDKPGLQEFHVDSADPNDVVSKILEMNRLAANAQEKLENFYMKGQLTLAGFAVLTGKTFVDIWGYIIGSRKLSLICSVVPSDIDQVRSDAGRPFVIDPVSILTIHFLEKQDELKKLGKIYVPKSTVALFKKIVESRRVYERDGYLSILEEDGKPVKQVISSSDIKKNIQYYEKIIAWIEAACEILPCEEVLNMNGARREELSDALGGDAFLETAVLASQKNALLISDDYAFRNVAKNDFKVTSFCTQEVFSALLEEGLIEQDLFDDVALKLCTARYSYTSINAGVLVKAVRQAGWGQGYPFDRVIGFLCGKNANLNSSVQVLMSFIYLLWYETCLPAQRDMILFSVFDEICKGRKRSEMAKLLEFSIKEAFKLLPLIERHLLFLLNQWKNSNLIE